MQDAIIFDFDGTLVDSIDAIVSAANAVADEQGISSRLSREVLRAQGIRGALKHMGVSILKAKRFVDDVKVAFEERSAGVKLHPGIQELLEELSKDYVLAVVSSSEKDFVQETLTRLGVAHYFRYIEHGGLFTKNKMLKQLKKELGSIRCLYVGDEPRDIHSARRAGMDSLSVTWGFAGEELLLKNRPTYIAASTTEVLRLIKHWQS